MVGHRAGGQRDDREVTVGAGIPRISAQLQVEAARLDQGRPDPSAGLLESGRMEDRLKFDR